MLKIMVTGKPSGFGLTTTNKDKGNAAAFTLTERRFLGGAVTYINWLVVVPEHKVQWVEAACKRGFTVLVEGDDVAVNVVEDAKGKQQIWYLQLKELHNI